MIDLILITGLQVTLFYVGYLIATLLNIKNKIEILGISFFLGSGLITLLFLFNHLIFKIPLNSTNFLISVLISTLTLLLIKYYNKQVIFSQRLNIKRVITNINLLSCFEKIMISLLVLIIFYTLVENYIWPITDWDSLALYDFRARVISQTGNMLEGVRLGYFFQYPPYTSFLHLFGYIFNLERVKIVYSIIYVSFLVTFYALLRRKQTRTISILATLFLSVDYFILAHATMAYTNLAYTAYITLGLLYLIFWLDNKNKKDFIIGMIFVALSTWIRPADPFWYIGMLLAVLGMYRNKKQIKITIFMMLFTLIIYKYWDLFLYTLPKNENFVNYTRESQYLSVLVNSKDKLTELYGNLPEITKYFYSHALKPVKYIFPLTLFSFVYDMKNNNNFNKNVYLLILGILSLIFFGIILFSLYYETWNQIGDSLQRASMVLIPLFTFALFNSNIWKEDVIEKK